MTNAHSRKGNKMTTLRNFEYLIAYGTEIEFFDIYTGETITTTAPNYGRRMNREVVSVYPLDKNKLRLSLGKEIKR